MLNKEQEFIFPRIVSLLIDISSSTASLSNTSSIVDVSELIDEPMIAAVLIESEFQNMSSTHSPR